MKQKYYLILGIIVIAIVVAVILLITYTTTEISVLTENPVIINKESSGAPSSPMDLILSITQFSEDKTSEITVKVGKRTGYKTEWFQANNTKVEIELPEGFELIEGNLAWTGDIKGEEVAELKIKVRAVKNGEWIIKTNAITNEFLAYESVGDAETVYSLVKDNEVLINDEPFTPISPNETAEKIK